MPAFDLGYIGRRRQNLRGRRPVRADRRLRTDQKAVRTQSAILDNNNPNPLLLLSITVFSERMCFSSVQKTRLARGARNGRDSHVTEYKAPYKV
jgi:hypothetical protein